VRECLELASSFLVSDLTMNPERQQGLNVWYTGFKQLVDLVVVLHRREQLDVATLNVATRACSECWTAAGNWRDLEDCRSCIREAAGKLRGILDPNSRTYRGMTVLFPSFRRSLSRRTCVCAMIADYLVRRVLSHMIIPCFISAARANTVPFRKPNRSRSIRQTTRIPFKRPS